MSLSPAEVLLVIAGAATLAVAIAWRTRARRRSRDLLRAALADPDPDAKRAAIHMVSEVGLARHADVLHEHLGREQDPEMLDAIADAIARNQWEPADQPAVFELRVWAHRRIEARPCPTSVRSVEAGEPPTATRPREAAEPAGPPCSVGPAEPVEPVGSEPVGTSASASALEVAAPASSQTIEVACPRSVLRYPMVQVVRFEEPADVTWLRWLMLLGTWLLWKVCAWRRQGRRTPWG